MADALEQHRARRESRASDRPADTPTRTDVTPSDASQRRVERGKRPHVTLHFAQSLDGRIATRSGAARWISGPEATRFAHELRANADAVLIGSGTALADDPLLTVRLVPGRQPLRVVLDGRSRVSDSARLLTDGSAPTLLVTRRGAPERHLSAHVERWTLPPAEGGEGVDLVTLLERLHARGMRSLLVEGGSRILTAFVRAALVDQLIATIAPIVVGSGIDAIGELGTDRLDQAMRFSTRRVWQLGADVLVELTTKDDAQGAPQTEP